MYIDCMADISRNSTLGPQQSTTKISERQERRWQIVNAQVYSKTHKLESLIDWALQEQQTIIRIPRSMRSNMLLLVSDISLG
jgi:hypothetical protein